MKITEVDMIEQWFHRYDTLYKCIINFILACYLSFILNSQFFFLQKKILMVDF